MYKILFGILFGVFLTLSVTFLWRTYWLRDYVSNLPKIEKISDTSKIAIQQSIMQIKLSSANFDEKFISINKRLDDFLVFGGIIITLLLAITVSVYLKTESEVNKHFEEKFGDHIKRMADYEKEAGILLGKIKTSLFKIESANFIPDQQTTQSETENEQSTTNG